MANGWVFWLVAAAASAAMAVSREDEAIIRELDFFENYELLQEQKPGDATEALWPWDIEDVEKGETA
jgi:hypothetical protein